MSKNYTLITHTEAEFGTIEGAPLVVIGGWSHSVEVNHSTFVQIQHVRRMDTGEAHPELDNRTFPYPSDAPQRDAYNAGILGYYVRGEQ